MVLFLLNLFLLNLPGLTGSHLLVSCYKEITIDKPCQRLVELPYEHDQYFFTARTSRFD